MRVLAGLVLVAILGAAVWWQAAGEGATVSVPVPAATHSAASIAGAASAAPGPWKPAASNDPWALLSRAEAAADAVESRPLPAELQKKALAWLDPARDAAWCDHVLPAQRASAQASEELGDELTLELALQQVFIRWIKVLRQRGDGRALAAADYLQAHASLGGGAATQSEPLLQRALNSQDGHVLALAAHLSCQPVQVGCQGLLSRWLQLEPRNEMALSWQLDLLPPGSSERLAALNRLADAQPDVGSQGVWAEYFSSLPRSSSAGLRQMAEQSVLESVHWAGSGPQSLTWVMACRKDKRPAAETACAKLAERLWQNERATLMEKVQAVLIGKSQAGAELQWSQRERTVKAVQAASARGHEEAGADSASAISCAGLVARHEWQQKLAREGEWRVFSQLAAQTSQAAQPVLRSPAAIPLIDK